MQQVSYHSMGDLTIIRVKVPLPFPLRWVNSYLLPDGQGKYTLIDPGLHTSDSEKRWEEVLQQEKIDFRQIDAIVLTHHHPDHYGLAGWMQEKTGAPVWMNETGYRLVESMWKGEHLAHAAMLQLFRRHGMDEALLAEIGEHLDSFVSLVSPQPDVSLLNTQAPCRLGAWDWLPIVTPGHAAGHLCFYEAQTCTMLCGDHVLPRISPNVSYTPEVDENPLASFIESLRRMREYRVLQALPGHRDPFYHFQTRVDELIVHHEQRLQQLLAILDEKKQAMTCCTEFFGEKLSIHQLRFALAETLAHLYYLAEQGAVDVQYSLEQDSVWFIRSKQLQC